MALGDQLQSRKKHDVRCEGIDAEELNIRTIMNAIAVKMELKRTIHVCSLYIPPSELATKKELQKLVRQLSRPFMITRDLKGRSHSCEYKKTNRQGTAISQLVDEEDLILLNNGESTGRSTKKM
jgi:hypothetical protein